MGAGLALIFALPIGISLIIFGSAGLHAAMREWGDEDVSNREYVVYGLVAILAGCGVLTCTFRLAGLL